MMNSSMEHKKFNILYTGIGIAVLLIVWEISARLIDMPIALPTMSETFLYLFKMIITLHFWKTLTLSLLRIALGFTLGVLLGIIFAFLSHFIPVTNGLISPVMTISRSTPVASFIMILWLMIELIFGLGGMVPVAISVLMIMPVIWQNMKDGFSATASSMFNIPS